MAVNLPKTLIFNFFILASLLIAIFLFQAVGKPYHRGFFCDDESISKPFKDSTVPSSIAGVIGILIPVLAIIIIELPKFREMRKDGLKPFYKSHWYGLIIYFITIYIYVYFYNRLWPQQYKIFRNVARCLFQIAVLVGVRGGEGGLGRLQPPQF